MRKIKRLAVLSLSILLVLSLVGCGYEKVEVSINSDGSGEAYGILGFTGDALETLVMYSGGSTDDLSLDDFEYFVIDGKEYYGYSESESFKSVADFNEMFSSSTSEGIGQTPNSSLEFGSIWLDDSDPNRWVLTVSATAAGEYEQYGDDMKDMYDSYEADLVQLLIINLPGTIKQEVGNSVGVEIDNNRLTIDFAKIGVENLEDKVFSIDMKSSASVKVNSPTKLIHFNDVRLGNWYYEAVMAMANAGVINGYGEFKFGPTDTLSVAQFAQIIYNYSGNNKSEGNQSYWAYDAIQSCLNNNIIANRGDINSENYDVSISREEAVAGLARAMKNVEVKHTYSIDEIADNKDISQEYKDDVLRAYNIGITNGVDSNKTFLPKRSLTRAELCQLIFNVK